ncbi:ATP-binding protein [Algoriphagus chordae]|uniref:ATP-binding protein n=1 Tax=Algoriphagus chordae TaxID=237019 RepID=UPI001B879912|nr:AAA family ATPase [Algoriphagus chordae]
MKWKTKLDPKPLLVKGARQVGKTSLIKDFGNKYYEQIAYFNFDRQPDLQQFFELTKDPERIIQNLSLVVGFPILPGETLIFFDEIQECKEALNSLKYFEESNLSHHIIGAGSLLGVTLGNAKSFPVGKVDFLDMYPLTFLEFLDAKDKEMHQYLQSIQSIEPIPDYFFNRILESFRLYTICGGLPEVAKELVESNSLERVEELLFAINRAYEYDFSKHVAEKDIQKIAFIWDSIPSQLSKENKKFLYQTVKKGARAREYEDALTWLIQAGLVYKVNRVNKVGIPFSGYDDLSAFKIYLLDMGLLRQKAQLEARSILNPNGLFSEFKGALVENYILQSLSAQFQIKPRYWTSDGIAEIDFLLQFNNELIPIEVKSEENVRSKSLTFYSKTYNPRVKLRFSMRNLINQEELINIPLFLADRTKFFLNQQLH